MTSPLKVPFYRHQLGNIEQKAISESLTREILSSGYIGEQVESELRDYFKVNSACLVNSWTNGALATLITWGIGPGHEVIIPAMTFVACANIVEVLGAKPVFCDVDPFTLLIDLEHLSELVNEKTRVVMPVHLYGQMVDIEAVRMIVGNSIYILEDAAHSFESTFNSLRPGSLSDAAIFSFYATKNISCGEGGAVISNNEIFFDELRQVILHGMSVHAKDRFKGGVFKSWDVERLGVKANLPDILASLIPSQLRTISTKLDRREAIAQFYSEALYKFSDIIKLPKNHGKGTHARHLFPIWVNPSHRDKVVSILIQSGIGCTINFRSVPTLSFYSKKYPEFNNTCIESQKWGEGVLSLPLFPTLTLLEMEYVVDVIIKQVVPILTEPGV